ncbi:MAG: histidine kinase [Rhodospirillaceae bacterium]|jgi:small ligand-binding sensory domain FIST|nr:histidine kinase [Rhodospirillaceae bacterium]MBT7486353.1 histidine kinase [Rhodospirillales bacterium]MBT4702526.1 histidine kinase [Rhodospirillaceae bacterium]MBT5036804.1 histidine kinase [Rhodospirillaceae bacterium]MBT6219108.1 histidine kinase [Rhodospirillaceae bacterium]
MSQFKTAFAEAEDWTGVAKSCADQLLDTGLEDASLGFLYVTEPLIGDLSSILTYLRQTTGVPHWVGAAAMGICVDAKEVFNRPAAAAMLTTLPEDQFRVLPTITDTLENISGEITTWMGQRNPTLGIVHADPSNAKSPLLVQNLAETSSSFLVGGLTSTRDKSRQVADEVTSGGISGILFAPEVQVSTGLSQGCVPVGESHLVSDSIDNVIIGLDGEKALDVFKNDIGELLSRDLNRVAGYVHAAIPIEGSDTGDYMVRDLVGIDPTRGWLAVGGNIQTGDRVMFVRRDPDTAQEDLVNTVEIIKNRLSGTARGGVYCSCIARSANMFGEEGREMALIRECLGDVPLIGFYAGGEFSNARLYSYTGVLTLFL